jgi:glycosyltransferase involved in cell wall biosynthesis
LCRAADRVITVSEGLAETLKTMTSAPVTVIPNGFDSSLLPAELPPPSRIFTILYAGTLVPVRQDPRPVFQALAICLNRGLIPRGEVEIIFLGTKPETLNLYLKDGFEHLPIRVVGRERHKQALALQTQASVLLVLAHASEKGIMTGKIFDYLAAGRPILAVPDDRDTTATLLRSTGAGVAKTEVESIAQQLSDWHREWRLNPFFNLARNKAAISKYSRFVQAGDLAQELNRLSTDHLSNCR